MTIQKIEDFNPLSSLKKSSDLPKNLEIEAMILGSIILEEESLLEVEGILKPHHFFSKANQKIYRNILDLWKESGDIGIVMLAERLKKQKLLKQVGDFEYLSQLTHRIAPFGKIENYARILLEYYMRRRALNLGEALAEKAKDSSRDIFSTLDEGLGLWSDLSMDVTKDAPFSMFEALKKTQDKLEALNENKGCFGIPSGFNILDSMINGFGDGRLYIVAGRPGMGKTSFLGALLLNAFKAGKKTAFFNMEMGDQELMDRIIALKTGIPYENINRTGLTEKEWKNFYDNTADLQNDSIFIDSEPGLTIPSLRSKIRRLKATKNIDMVIVDYLGLLRIAEKTNFGRYEEVSKICAELKSMAKEFSIPIIVASQLNRSVETRGGDRRPELQDLRDSGSIEQDADVVMFLYRPEYYGLLIDEKGDSTENRAEVIVAKNRSGKTGKVKLKWDATRMRFEDLVPEQFVDKNARF